MIPWHIKKHLIKTINEKPTANIILNGEKFKAFPLRLGIRQTHPLLPPLFDILPVQLMQKDFPKIKSIQINKEEIKLSLFADNMIVYKQNLKDQQKTS